MRLCANENVPGECVAVLRQRGHEVLWIREVARGSGDEAVLARAQADARLLITFDKDFGELVFKGKIVDAALGDKYIFLNVLGQGRYPQLRPLRTRERPVGDDHSPGPHEPRGGLAPLTRCPRRTRYSDRGRGRDSADDRRRRLRRVLLGRSHQRRSRSRRAHRDLGPR